MGSPANMEIGQMLEDSSAASPSAGEKGDDGDGDGDGRPSSVGDQGQSSKKKEKSYSNYYNEQYCPEVAVEGSGYCRNDGSAAVTSSGSLQRRILCSPELERCLSCYSRLELVEMLGRLPFSTGVPNGKASREDLCQMLLFSMAAVSGFVSEERMKSIVKTVLQKVESDKDKLENKANCILHPVKISSEEGWEEKNDGDNEEEGDIQVPREEPQLCAVQADDGRETKGQRAKLLPQDSIRLAKGIGPRTPKPDVVKNEQSSAQLVREEKKPTKSKAWSKSSLGKRKNKQGRVGPLIRVKTFFFELLFGSVTDCKPCKSSSQDVAQKKKTRLEKSKTRHHRHHRDQQQSQDEVASTVLTSQCCLVDPSQIRVCSTSPPCAVHGILNKRRCSNAMERKRLKRSVRFDCVVVLQTDTTNGATVSETISIA